MLCSIKGAYPLRVDVFGQGECDVGTEASAGIILVLKLKGCSVFVSHVLLGKKCVWTAELTLCPPGGLEHSGHPDTPHHALRES